MKKVICLILSVLFTISFCACTNPETDKENLTIVAVSFPEYDFARAVAGGCADIKMLIPPASEVHGYEPTVSDIKAVSNCDLFIYTGGESDSWVEDLLESASNEKLITFALIDHSDSILDKEEHEDEHNHDKYKIDEHVWTSPKNVISIINNLKFTLSEIDKENKSVYELNAKSYCERLDELNSSIKEITDNSKNKTLVFGDRFPLTYFAKEYNLDYLAAFHGCSEDTEASASTIASLIDFVKENNISVVFINELSNTSIADQISKETGAEVKTFYSCHKVSKDDFESGKTYIDIISRNIETLKIALN